jgi:hypothetical protein
MRQPRSGLGCRSTEKKSIKADREGLSNINDSNRRELSNISC